MMFPQVFVPLVPSAVVAAALVVAERRKGRPRGDCWRNLQGWALQLVIAGTVLAWCTLPVHRSLLAGGKLPFWPGLAIFIVVRDLAEYLFHRAQHRIPLLWAMHSLHHSDPNMQALTTQRHFWSDQLLKNLTIWPATLLIISPTSAILASFGTIMLWNYVVHSGLRFDFGRWSWLLNSPAYHRRHHSIHPEHFDSNFAALLPIFDVIFGSYHRPSGFPDTGLAHRPESLAEMVVWPLIWNDPSHWRAFSTRPGLQRRSPEKSLY